MSKTVNKPIQAPRPPREPQRGAAGGRGKKREDARPKQRAAVPIK